VSVLYRIIPFAGDAGRSGSLDADAIVGSNINAHNKNLFTNIHFIRNIFQVDMQDINIIEVHSVMNTF
jgi:hypothetical protein